MKWVSDLNNNKPQRVSDLRSFTYSAFEWADLGFKHPTCTSLYMSGLVRYEMGYRIYTNVFRLCIGFGLFTIFSFQIT